MFELAKGKNLKISIAYVILQILIWAKCAWFFLLYGHGRVALFNMSAFPADALLIDNLFHFAMHVGIGILALLFGKNISKAGLKKRSQLAAIMFVAVAVHNLGYWLTASHGSLLYSIEDFASDFIILYAFVLAGFLLKEGWVRMKNRKQNI